MNPVKKTQEAIKENKIRTTQWGQSKIDQSKK